MSKASVDKTSCTRLPPLLSRATRYSRDHGAYVDDSIEMPAGKQPSPRVLRSEPAPPSVSAKIPLRLLSPPCLELTAVVSSQGSWRREAGVDRGAPGVQAVQAAVGRSPCPREFRLLACMRARHDVEMTPGLPEHCLWPTTAVVRSHRQCRYVPRRLGDISDSLIPARFSAR